MDTLQGMQIFVRVAQGPGFAAAARELRMSPAAVTKHVAALESRVGARLFDRTTRRVALTEAGRVYLERCVECLRSFEDADASVKQLSKEPAGVLRVTAPIDFQAALAPVLARFVVAHAGVTVDLRLSNRPVDLVEEGVDVAVRVAPALEGQFVARPVAMTRIVLAAAPSYLRAHAPIRAPGDLRLHKSVVFVEPKPRDEWVFARGAGRKRVTVKLSAVMMTNGGEAVRTALVEGVGVAPAPSFLVHADLAAGRLVQVLPEWSIVPDLRVFVLYPHRRFLSPKVRAFVEALRGAFGDGTRDPWAVQAARA